MPFDCVYQDAACLLKGNEPEKGITLAGARPAKDPNASATSLESAESVEIAVCGALLFVAQAVLDTEEAVPFLSQDSRGKMPDGMEHTCDKGL